MWADVIRRYWRPLVGKLRVAGCEFLSCELGDGRVGRKRVGQFAIY